MWAAQMIVSFYVKTKSLFLQVFIELHKYVFLIHIFDCKVTCYIMLHHLQEHVFHM